MASKRKRGCNYTAQETNKLLDLVEQYKSFVEDKRTGTVYLSGKKEAWEKICVAYNAVATSGLRTVEQLKVFYDNKKQKARKSLAMHNKNEFMKHHKELSHQNVTEDDLKIALEHAKTDKGQWNKTGGGSWCPTVDDNDQKILAIIKDQVTPLPNSWDSAAVYFGDLPDIEIQEEATNFNFPASPSQINVTDGHGSTEIEIEYRSDHDGQSSQNMVSPIKQANSKKRPQHNKNGATPIKMKKKLVNSKKIYFKRKSQNALTQKRKLLLEIRLRQMEHQMFIKEHKLRLEEHKLKLEEHKLRLQFMQKEHDEKMKTWQN